MKVTWDVFVCVYCMDESYLKCFCLCILYGWKLLEMPLFMFSNLFVLMKVTWDAFVCVLNTYNFFMKKIINKKKTVLIPSISILLLYIIGLCKKSKYSKCSFKFLKNTRMNIGQGLLVKAYLNFQSFS